VWGGWLSKKPFQKELAMHRLTFDPGQRQVLLLVYHKTFFGHILFLTYLIAVGSQFIWLSTSPHRGFQELLCFFAFKDAANVGLFNWNIKRCFV
jgi:hypothetical protein